jgi:DNA-binding PadR family transcriptional regulator
MKDRSFTPESVFDYLHKNRGTRYSAPQLARNFDVPPQRMRNLLTHLVDTRQVRTTVDGCTRIYYILTEQEEELLNRRRMATEWKPLSQDYIKQLYSAHERAMGR